MDAYVGQLAAELREYGVRAPLKVMQSNGGVITADAARERPVDTLLSGPAAGVRGATYVADRDPSAVARDLRLGKITPDAARAAYGDAVDSLSAAGRGSIDGAASEQSGDDADEHREHGAVAGTGSRQVLQARSPTGMI